MRPPSHAPRNASTPCALSRLRILAVATGVYRAQIPETTPSFFAHSVRQAGLYGKSPVLSSLPPLLVSLRSFSRSLPLFSIDCSLFLQNTWCGISRMLLRDAGVGWASRVLLRDTGRGVSRSDSWTLGGSRRRLPVPEMQLRDTRVGVDRSRTRDTPLASATTQIREFPSSIPQGLSRCPRSKVPASPRALQVIR